MAVPLAAATPPVQDRPQRRPYRRAGLLYPVLIGLALVFVVPLLWIVVTSFKTDYDATRIPPTLLPQPWTTEAYRTLLDSGQAPVFRWFLNSLLAATLQSVLILVTATCAAYPLARMEFPGKRLIYAGVVSTLFLPPVILLIPNYLIVDRLGWLDSLWAVVVPGAAGAFGVFFLRQFFLALPREIEEAALLDGASRMQIFLRMVLPLSRPALATLTVLSFLANWNDFLWPVYVLLNPENLTLQPGLSILQGAYTAHYSVIMAGAVVASVPVLVLFAVVQRQLVASVSHTGIKG